MRYKRLYTFGCSFTKWYWPCWPEIIAHDTGLPFENWGASAAGNVGIANRMLECDLHNKLTQDDLVLVCWSTFCREDRFFDGDGTGWYFAGNIHNNQKIYNEEWRKKYWSSSNDIIKNMHSIITARRSFPIDFEAQIIEELGSKSFSNYNQKVYDFYKPYFPNRFFPWDTSYQQPFNDYANTMDGHPDIEAHLKFVTDCIYPNIGLTIKESTVNYFMQQQKYIIDLPKPKFKKFTELHQWFKQIWDYREKSIGVYSDH